MIKYQLGDLRKFLLPLCPGLLAIKWAINLTKFLEEWRMVEHRACALETVATFIIISEAGPKRERALPKVTLQMRGM